MLVRRIGLVAVPLLVLAAMVVATGGGAIQPGGQPTAAPSQTAKKINLATYPAKRWIVQLNGAPLATYRGGVSGLRATAAVATGASHLNVSSSRSRAYVGHLRSVQHAFAQRLVRRIPTAHVQRTYQIVLNGLAVRMSRAQASIVRKLKGVRAVTPDIPYRLQMFSTPAQIGAPTLWGQVGGQSNAGSGVKVAIVDSGIFVRHDANGAYTGNPCFEDTGYTAPAGYPRGDTRFTNNKVLVARAYFRPDDPPIAGENTPIQGTNAASPHGTHVAGTVACNAGTPVTFQGANVTISGIAPHAYLMNYRVFYPSQSPEDFQNGNAYTVELVQAIEDAVTDGADVISSSWGSSYQNTLAWPDPMIQAADDAVDAGVVMVFANGNAGPDNGTAISPAISPKVIGVGAVTKNATIVPGDVSVTAPAPVPANLTGLAVGPAGFGPQVTTQTGPALYKPAQAALASNTLGCNPFPAGSLAGQIALIARGTCEFSTKVLNAQNAGAIAALIYNSAAGGDNLQSMGPGAVAGSVTIPSWFMRRSEGLNMVSFYNSNPGTAEAKFVYSPHVAANIGDVMAGFSSRGPSQDKLIKPDVSAPGVDVLSSGYGDGAFPGPFTGFGSVSGTSMATPHVAGSAALLRQLHPLWTPAQIKSALMTTATEDVFLNTTLTARAGVLDRGAGRIDLTKAGTPGLTLDLPSLSGGELAAGQSVDFTIGARDVSGGGGTWSVSAVKTSGGTNFDIAPTLSSITVGPNGTTSLPVHIAASPAAAPGSYEGKVVLDNAATGRQLHVPVWLRVLPTNPTADVLLVDDDGSDAGFTDYSTVYTDLLTSLGVSYQYVDPWNDGFPSFFNLFGYKAVVIFTGDNDSFDTSGFFPSDQDALTEWLDSGGRLWTIGQNFAEESDSNGSYSSPSLGRARLYHGYLGVKYVSGSAYAGAAPRPTATGLGPMAGLTLDLSPGADGAGNQSSIEVTSPMPDNDTYEAAHTMRPLFRAVGSPVQGAGDAISFGRSAEPSLEEERIEYRYRSVSMGFGLEGLSSSTGFTSRSQLGRATLNWLLDRITFGPITKTTQKPKGVADKKVVLTASPASSAGATFTRFRWDFGDGSAYVTTTTPSVAHKYKHAGTYGVRVEATDSLGHRAVQHQAVAIHNH
jgi:subtilisin family serine protease